MSDKKEILIARLNVLRFRVDPKDFGLLDELRNMGLNVIIGCLGGWNQGFMLAKDVTEKGSPAISLSNGLTGLDDKLKPQGNDMISSMESLNAFLVLVALVGPENCQKWYPSLSKQSTNLRCMSYKEAQSEIPKYY